MRETPLIGPYDVDDVLAWDQKGPRTVRQFLADVASLAESLPDRPTALNLATNRYDFLVGFAAAIMRRQVTLLPQSRASHTLLRIAGEYPGSYALTDRDDAIEGIDSVSIQLRGGQASWQGDIPRILLDQVVAVAFTSGSTGRPVPNKKTWGALTAVAQATGARLGIKTGDRLSVVATVPHQHMFGLEASVMLPIMHGLAMHAGRPLFPADIRSVLVDAASRWMLVTTPLHLRACLSESIRMPSGGRILSATAPLSRHIAQQAEEHFQAEVHEIFGFAEAGSIAERRTIDGDRWRPLEGVHVAQDASSCLVQAWYLPAPVPVPDRMAVDSDGTFIVHGREADQVNIAGHRVSLGDLNQTLLQIDGVQDGVFFLPEEETGLVTRLMAFVVAPGKTSEEIQRKLRAHVDPVFMPRPLVCVPSLPRNATGKLPRESVSELARQWLEREGDGA
ncbi:MAG: acyl-CoA synthetase [Nitrospira sp.]|nr:acyl-CoA synthetase [Nitrospira sp.]MBH0180140.1 acyl-CoA synthetase [Nitrospira sp.]MBH0185937.1 acyl-CoA synthetase [Nitrospira sp.]